MRKKIQAPGERLGRFEREPRTLRTPDSTPSTQTHMNTGYEGVFEMSDDESLSEEDFSSDGGLSLASESSTIPPLRTSRRDLGSNPSTPGLPLRSARFENSILPCGQMPITTTVAPINHFLESTKTNPTRILLEDTGKSHTLREDAYLSLNERYPMGVTAHIVNVVNGYYQPPFIKRMHLSTAKVLAAAKAHCVQTYGGQFEVLLKSISCGETELVIRGDVPRLDLIADGMCVKGPVSEFQIVVDCRRASRRTP